MQIALTLLMTPQQPWLVFSPVTAAGFSAQNDLHRELRAGSPLQQSFVRRTCRVLALLLIFSTLVAQGQETKPPGNYKKILLGLNFSPDYNFRTLDHDNSSSSGDLLLKNRNDSEVAKFGFTTGLNAWFSFSKWIGLETGIQYANKGYKTKSRDLIYTQPDPNAPARIQANYSYQYISIPVKARFTAGNSNIRFLSSAGIMTEFLLKVKQTTQSEYADGRKNKDRHSTTSGFEKVSLSPTISIGIDYKLNDDFYFIAEPTFRYGVTKTTDTPVNENLWNAGLNIGFYYGLK